MTIKKQLISLHLWLQNWWNYDLNLFDIPYTLQACFALITTCSSDGVIVYIMKNFKTIKIELIMYDK